jgi:hypothetical protein
MKKNHDDEMRRGGHFRVSVFVLGLARDAPCGPNAFVPLMPSSVYLWPEPLMVRE